MLVKVSNVMVKELNRLEQERGGGNVYCMEEVRPEYYRGMIGRYPEDNMTDWNAARGKMRILVLNYPPEDYAVPRYLTTRDLNAVFNKSDGTLEGFYRALLEETEI